MEKKIKIDEVVPLFCHVYRGPVKLGIWFSLFFFFFLSLRNNYLRFYFQRNFWLLLLYFSAWLVEVAEIEFGVHLSTTLIFLPFFLFFGEIWNNITFYSSTRGNSFEARKIETVSQWDVV